ncbi:MAG TPA: nucleotide exchange factor GrpE [Phycisphaerae bacterium]|nr:nucleotide exchange factor GrpE [Phycisphaerae bacterium]HRY69081.1 nucleotide exchange factor GrpE [Phycisphaerae bacterium]HSA25944.1 nucleotide exchange factor GrpE [Phycisphaerae bacterium]
MAKKGTGSRSTASASTGRALAAKAKTKPASGAAERSPAAAKAVKRGDEVAHKADAAKSAGTGTVCAGEDKTAASRILARAEADITAAIEAMNNQMNSAMSRLTELAAAQCGKGHAVVRTAPLDRATATFQRLVAEVIDDQLAEMLPPLISLRNECAQRVDGSGQEAADDDFAQRGKETLDHVLMLAGVQSYEPRLGELFDPIIHLAVGECHRQDLAANSVGQTVQPGFRSARGKVLVAAKVLVNRR